MIDQNFVPRVTTTHAAWGSGRPHLIIGRDSHRVRFALSTDIVRIGSGSEVELVLRGADAVHATIQHDERDEYVLIMHGAGTMNATRPEDQETDERTEVLRTGAHFTISGWKFIFARDEASDHGRPYGGRNGGEWSHQRRQEPRPDYHQDVEESADMMHAADGPVVLHEHPEFLRLR